MSFTSPHVKNFQSIGQAGICVFALLFPMATAQDMPSSNAAAFVALGIVSIFFSGLLLFWVWNEPIAFGSLARVSVSVSALLLFYLSILLTVTFGFQFGIVVLPVTWAAVLAVFLRPAFLDAPVGRRLRILLTSLVAVVFAACLLTYHQHTTVLGSDYRRTGLAAFCGCVVVFVVAVVAIPSPDGISRAVHSLLFASGMVGILAILQFYDPGQSISHWFPRILHDPRAMGTMGHPNWFGTFLCLVLPLAAVEFLLSRTRWREIWFLSLCGILFAALLVCQTRGAWVAFSLFSAWIAWRQHARWEKLAMLFCLFALITVVLMGSRDELIAKRFATFDKELDSASEMAPGTGSSRFGYWAYSLQNLPPHMILGSGLDTYDQAGRPGGTPASADKAHSIYFEYALTLGLPGLVLYVVFLWSCVAPPCEGPDGLRGWGFRAAILTYFVQGIFIHDTIHTWPLVWLIAGLAVANRTIQGKPTIQNPRRLAFCGDPLPLHE
jgi:O-antigen ligase